MNLPASIVIVLSQFSIPSIDRDEANRNDRLTSIAIAITRAAEHATCTGAFAVEGCKKIASDPNVVASELMAKTEAETNLRKNVHLGACKNWECDPVRVRVKGGYVIYHQARGLWQAHRKGAWSSAEWDSLLGTTQQATDATAWEATKSIAGYKGMCDGGIAGAFAAYGAGRCIKPSEKMKRRARRAEAIRVRLVNLQASEAKDEPGC
jgi:hypothetical protein